MKQHLKYKCKNCGSKYGEEPSRCWAPGCSCQNFELIDEVSTV